MDCEFSFQDADFLLRRDWFLGVEDIDEFLWCLSDSVFSIVLQRRYSYSPRIQAVLYLYQPVKKRAGDLTDEDMANILKEEELRIIQARKESLKQYIPPTRPAIYWDTQLKELSSKIEGKNNELTKYYKHPRMYTSQISDLEIEIRNTQNEFDYLNQKIDAYNTIWKELQWIQNASSVREKHILS